MFNSTSDLVGFNYVSCRFTVILYGGRVVVDHHCTVFVVRFKLSTSESVECESEDG